MSFWENSGFSGFDPSAQHFGRDMQAPTDRGEAKLYIYLMTDVRMLIQARSS
jgi:hypothetical protein